MLAFLIADSSIAIKTGGCFPSSGLATLSDGRRVTMDALQVGDSVLAMDADGGATYSKIVMFMDAREERQQLMYTITTEGGRELTLTPGHMVYSTSENFEDVTPQDLHPVFASRIREGDYIFVLDSNTRWQQAHRWRPEKVVQMQTSKQNGVFAPLTESGNMVVDGVLVSCYAMIDSVNIAHWSFAPFRMLRYIQELFTDSHPETNSTLITSPPQHGIHWYAEILHKIGEYVVHKDLWYDS